MNTIELSMPKWFRRLAIWGQIIIFAPPIMKVILSDEDLFSIIQWAVIFSPLIVGLLSMRRYKITVCDDVITVKPPLKRTYSFNVNEISNVVHKTNLGGPNGNLLISNMILYRERKRTSVDSIMVGFEDMEKYIFDHVDSDKIIMEKPKRPIDY